MNGVSVAAERCNVCLGPGVLEFEGNKSVGKEWLRKRRKEGSFLLMEGGDG